MPKAHSVLYGLNINELARLCRVSLKTAGRWKGGQIVAPYCATELLEILLDRDLGKLDPEWRGWKLRNGELVSPEGWQITTGDVLASPLLRAQLAAYQTENRELRGLAEAFEEDQPLPGAWEIQIVG